MNLEPISPGSGSKCDPIAAFDPRSPTDDIGLSPYSKKLFIAGKSRSRRKLKGVTANKPSRLFMDRSSPPSGSSYSPPLSKDVSVDSAENDPSLVLKLPESIQVSFVSASRIKRKHFMLGEILYQCFDNLTELFLDVVGENEKESLSDFESDSFSNAYVVTYHFGDTSHQFEDDEKQYRTKETEFEAYVRDRVNRKANQLRSSLNVLDRLCKTGTNVKMNILIVSSCVTTVIREGYYTESEENVVNIAQNSDSAFQVLQSISNSVIVIYSAVTSVFSELKHGSSPIEVSVKKIRVNCIPTVVMNRIVNNTLESLPKFSKGSEDSGRFWDTPTGLPTDDDEFMSYLQEETFSDGKLDDYEDLEREDNDLNDIHGLPFVATKQVIDKALKLFDGR